MNIVMRYPEGRAKAFTMSYDDGYYQDVRLVEIMNKNGLKGTFNIGAGRIAKTDATRGGELLSAKQIKELYVPNGHEVAAHSYSHPVLVDLPTENVTYEYIRDKAILEDITGTIVRGSAYPYSNYNDKVLEALKACGISYARGGQETEAFHLPTDWLQIKNTARHVNPRLMELGEFYVGYAVPPHMPSTLFYLMGHSFEFDRDNNWDLIESFAEMIGGHDDIWYATNGEIFEYLQACELLEFSADGSMVKNPTAIDIYIDYLYKQRIVPAGKTIRMDSGESL